jgi:primosomal protein N' (replication factor Y)
MDVLVGTQMLAKGLDFDNVSLVGIMNADNMLYHQILEHLKEVFK